MNGSVPILPNSSASELCAECSAMNGSVPILPNSSGLTALHLVALAPEPQSYAQSVEVNPTLSECANLRTKDVFFL